MAETAQTNFTCEVCCNDCALSERCNLGVLEVGNNNRVRHVECGHPICQTCMAQYVETRVSEVRVWNLTCPHDGCTTELREQDVKKLADQGKLGAETLNQFIELRNCDQKERASKFLSSIGDFYGGSEDENEFEALLKLYRTTRLCPRCSMVLEKSEGCNSFYCVCGYHFCFADAPRVVGQGMKEKVFHRAVAMAKEKGLSLSEAEKYHGDHKDWGRALRMSNIADLSLSEAREICQQARRGDEEAREKIREARKRQRLAEEKEEAEGDLDEENVACIWS